MRIISTCNNVEKRIQKLKHPKKSFNPDLLVWDVVRGKFKEGNYINGTRNRSVVEVPHKSYLGIPSEMSKIKHQRKEGKARINEESTR